MKRIFIIALLFVLFVPYPQAQAQKQTLKNNSFTVKGGNFVTVDWQNELRKSELTFDNFKQIEKNVEALQKTARDLDRVVKEQQRTIEAQKRMIANLQRTVSNLEREVNNLKRR